MTEMAENRPLFHFFRTLLTKAVCKFQAAGWSRSNRSGLEAVRGEPLAEAGYLAAGLAPETDPMRQARRGQS
jgi:hypothetical protein